ncbi:MAG: hypothetical protein WCY93_08715 [Anaerolineaceae bacterium]
MSNLFNVAFESPEVSEFRKKNGHGHLGNAKRKMAWVSLRKNGMAICDFGQNGGFRVMTAEEVKAEIGR